MTSKTTRSPHATAHPRTAEKTRLRPDPTSILPTEPTPYQCLVFAITAQLTSK